MFMAKEVKKTEKGTWYAILQDAPHSFHISVSKDNLVLYDHVENPTRIEDIHAKVNELEIDLLNRIPTQNNT